MSLLLGKKYLRVTTPETTDGQNLRYTEDGSRVLTKESHLPVTARKHLEAQNANLPVHLRHKIEEVENEEMEGEDPGEAAKTKGRPGRKPKVPTGENE